MVSFRIIDHSITTRHRPVSSGHRISMDALSQVGGPTQSQLYRPVSGHHISMEHRLRRKQLNSDTNASNKTYLQEIQEKRQEETFFLRKIKKKEKPKSNKMKRENMQAGSLFLSSCHRGPKIKFSQKKSSSCNRYCLTSFFLVLASARTTEK